MATFADAGQLNVQYTFIGDYALPASYTIIQKLSGNAQQTQGGTSLGNPGYKHDISLDRFEVDAQEYYINFQPAPPFVLEMKGDCQGKVPIAGEIKNCLAEFRLPPPPAPASVPAPDSTPIPTPTPEPSPTIQPICTEDIWSCGSYGACSVAGIQSRSCTKVFDCPDVQTAIPMTDQSCQPVAQAQSIQDNQDKQDSAKFNFRGDNPKKSEATSVATKIENKKQLDIKEEENVNQNSPVVPSMVIEKTASNQIKKQTSDNKVKPLIQNKDAKSTKPNQEVKQNDNPVSAQVENQIKSSFMKRFMGWVTRWFK